MEKTLTVTIPSYNVEKYLPEIIPTFLAPEILGEIEILIVNDGSKDRTAEIAGQFEKDYPNTIRLVDKENGGHGSTINKGIELAQGKYFKVVDGDDWVDTEQFVRYVKRLKELDQDIVLTPFNRVNIDSGEIEKKTLSGISFDTEYSVSTLLGLLGESYQMHSTTFKTSVLKQIRPIDEHCFYVDQEYIVFPLPYAKTAVCLDFTIYQYRVGNNEQSVSMQSLQRNREMHFRVIRTLLEYVGQADCSEEGKAFMKFRIAGMCAKQVEIYCAMAVCKETYAELRNFLRYMKEKSDLYSLIPGRKAQLLRWNTRFYYLTAWIMKGKRHV